MWVWCPYLRSQLRCTVHNAQVQGICCRVYLSFGMKLEERKEPRKQKYMSVLKYCILFFSLEEALLALLDLVTCTDGAQEKPFYAVHFGVLCCGMLYCSMV